MQGLKELIAMTMATGCLFTDASETPNHICTLLQHNVMEQSGASVEQIGEELQQILTEGVDADLWNSFGAEFSREQWESFIGQAARHFGVHLE